MLRGLPGQTGQQLGGAGPNGLPDLVEDIKILVADPPHQLLEVPVRPHAADQQPQGETVATRRPQGRLRRGPVQAQPPARLQRQSRHVHIGEQKRLVEGLHPETTADRPQVGHWRTERLEHRPRQLERRRRTAHHDGELARLRARPGTADRRIQDGDTFGHALPLKFHYGLDRDSGMDENDPTGRHATKDAVFGEDHLMHVLVGDHVAVSSELDEVRRTPVNGALEGNKACLAPSPQCHRKPSLDEAVRHRLAYITEPDEANPKLFDVAEGQLDLPFSRIGAAESGQLGSLVRHGTDGFAYPSMPAGWH